MRTLFRSTAVALVLLAPTGALRAQAPAHPPIYPPTGAAADVDAALAAARHDGKYVLLDFGADWCPDCRALAILFDAPAVVPFVEANFHVVRVDVGRRDKNADLVASYQATSADWIPAIVVLDADGRPVARTDTNARLTRRSTTDELLDLLRRWSPKRAWRDLSSFTESGVRVDMRIDRDSTGAFWLAAVFQPLAPGAYLYATDLPADGVNGLGRPTRLALIDASGLRARGGVTANRPVHADRIAALNATLIEYPAGPVTLSMPIAITARGDDARAEVSVTYMTCGPRGCLPPVVDRRIAIGVRR